MPDGRPVRDAQTLQRIRQLAIPPAYSEVWICTKPNSHVQATGRDARRRKQYRYHPDWAQVRGDGKFERIMAFGQARPGQARPCRGCAGACACAATWRYPPATRAVRCWRWWWR